MKAAALRCLCCQQVPLSKWFHRCTTNAGACSCNIRRQPVLKIHSKQRPFSSSMNIQPTRIPPLSEMKQFFDNHKIYYEQGYTCLISTCPAPLKSEPPSEGLEKIYINMNTGNYVCNHCNSKGHWSKLQNNLIKMEDNQKKHCHLARDERKGEDTTTDDHLKLKEEIDNVLSKCVHISAKKATKQLLARFDIKDLTLDTLGKFNIYVCEKDVVIPYYDRRKKLKAIKTLSGTRKSAKSTFDEITIPKYDFHGLFGWNTIDREDTEVILTLSEFDAMMAYQETKCPSLALPKGGSILHPEVLPWLEQFTKVILWFGNDVNSWQSAKYFSKKLNEDRCFVIGPGQNISSPLASKKQSVNLNNALRHAVPVRSQSITSFHDLRKEVFSELAHVDQVAGIKWARYPQLNKLLKGHRRGELTVLTGPTGSGKTTFISEYSLDLCTQGVHTLWGSFEIKNVRLMKMMLTQFSMTNISKQLSEFDHWADKFEGLPMHFMTFHGQENIDKVVETMTHAVYMHDISHVVVDNLQFMMGVSTSDRMFVDRFTRQDQIVAAFRKFSTIMNCHVTLVIHPRKEEDTTELTVTSIFGGAKASQEADNILILQASKSVLKGKKYLQVVKNRFDGDLGAMALKFDKESLSFTGKEPSKPKQPKTVQSNIDDKSQEHHFDDTNTDTAEICDSIPS